MHNHELNNQTTLFELIARHELAVQEGRTPYYQESVYHRLIDYYEREFLYETALQVVEVAIKHYPFTVDFLLRKVHLSIFNNQIENALQTVDMAAALDPGSVDIKLHRSYILAEIELFKESLNIIESLKHFNLQGEVLSTVYFYEGLVYERMEQFEQMYWSLEEAIKLDPENDNALEKMWWCVERSAHYESSIRLHEWVVKVKPFSFWGWFNLANALEYCCEYEKAVEAYEFALVINENSEIAYRQCAEVYFNMMKYEEALKHYEDVLQRFDPDSDILVRVAMCNIKLGKIAPAKKYLMMAEEEDDYNDEVFYHLGLCYAAEQKWQKAIHYFRQAIRIESGREEYYRGLAEAWQNAGNIEKAEKFFRKAAVTGPEFAENWIAYAGFLKNNNRHEEALQILMEAEECIDDTSLKYCRVGCLMAMTRCGEALYFLGEALDENFEQNNFLFEFEPALRENEQIRSAISAYHRTFSTSIPKE